MLTRRRATIWSTPGVRGARLSPLSPLGVLNARRTTRATAAALLVLAGLWGLVWWLNRPPNALEDFALVGARGPTCIRFVVAADVSGSMADFAEPRDRALEQLLTWAPLNLRADDEVMVLAFADAAVPLSSPTRIDDIATTGLNPPQSRSSEATAVDAASTQAGTMLEPVLQLTSELTETTCDTALVIVGDGQFFDVPTTETEALERVGDAHIHDTALLVPSKGIEVPSVWSEAVPFAKIARFDGNDANATGVALGKAIARATGQDLDAK